MRRRIISAIVIILVLCCCMGENMPIVKAKTGAETLTMVTKKKTLVAGKTVQLKVEYTDNSGKTKEVPGKQVNWSVSDKTVATITKTGVLKGKTVGNVTITAKYQGKKVTYRVRIKGKQVIGIDAGHQAKGNGDKEAIGPGASVIKAKVSSGTTGVSSRVPEYKLTLAIAKQLKEELIARGYEVVMTRTTNDVDISNKERALLLNEACDIGIRLHCDGSSSSTVKGATALYTSTKNPYVKASVSKNSKLLANALMEHYCEVTGIKNRGGSYRDDLTGNNWSTIPNVVLEMGFMSNASEDEWMQKRGNQAKMVQGIADGIDAYFK